MGPVFVALADPTRRQVVRLLAEGGSATATELAGQLPMTRQGVAKHLGALGRAGLVVG
ncbi:MAG: ArsR/SmtB family transcription factor, partial [Acidimicrobiales bacterium]